MDKNKVIELASKLISKGQFEKAVKEYQRILEVDPDDVRVLQKLAELYQKMNRKAEAADCFEKVARTYATQGFYLKAVALYKQVLKVIDRVEVNVRLAELYQQLGLVGDATKEWQTVAAYYEKIGDTKASLDTLRKLVDLDPDNVAARIRLGEQYARQDQLVEAVTELRRAAQYLQRNGRHDDYTRVAERISHLDQSDIALARELAESYLSRGDSKRALAKLQICFKANPRDLGTLQMLGRAFQELGQVSKTVSVLKELARVHLEAGRTDDARKTYQQALELAPEDAEVKASVKSLESEGAVAPRPVTARLATPGRAPPPAEAGPAQARPTTGPVLARPPTAPVVARPPTAPVVFRPATAPIASARSPARPPAPPAAARPDFAQASRPPPPFSSGPSRPPLAPASSPPAPPSAPPSLAQVPKLLKETEVYVKYGLHEKALEHLRKIFSADPDNTEAHEKAKVVALATHRKDEAIASLAALVRLYGERQDPRADAVREELRAQDPGHAALAARPPAPSPAALDAVSLVGEQAGGAAPTADLELGEPIPAPFAEQPAVTSVEALPAPGLDEPTQEHEEIVVEEIVEETVDDQEFPEPAPISLASDEAEEATRLDARPAEAAAPTEAGPAPEAEGDEFASDIAEADFYLQAGLGEDARAILEAILLASPDHPGASRRLQEQAAASGAREAGQAPEAALEQPEAPASRDHDDLAAELAAELAADAGGAVQADEALDDDVLDPFQVPAQEVLGEFRAKVQEAVRPEDVQTHYDLGIAYKEMGLVEEAVAEFELALRHGGGTRAADCLTMLGMCDLERGRSDLAIERFKRGLALPKLHDEARRAMVFELASAYEVAGHNAEALEQYQQVDREDGRFRDVQDRIKRLGGTVSGRTGLSAPPRAGLRASAPPPARTAPPLPGKAAASSQARAGSLPPPAPGRPPAAAPASGTSAPAASTSTDDPGPESAEARKARKIGFV